MHFNPVELIIILLIVVVLFGAGRVSKLGGELGSAIRDFKRNVSDDTVPTVKTPEELADRQ